MGDHAAAQGFHIMTWDGTVVASATDSTCEGGSRDLFAACRLQ